jgi:hypothetical protein
VNRPPLDDVGQALAAFGAPSGVYRSFASARAEGRAEGKSGAVAAFPLLASALPQSAWDGPAPGPAPAPSESSSLASSRQPAAEPQVGPERTAGQPEPSVDPEPRVVLWPAKPVTAPGDMGGIRPTSRSLLSPSAAGRNSDRRPLADVFRILRGETAKAAGSDSDNRLQDLFRRL